MRISVTYSDIFSYDFDPLYVLRRNVFAHHNYVFFYYVTYISNLDFNKPNSIKVIRDGDEIDIIVKFNEEYV